MSQAVLYAHGLERMAAFYRDCLGFEPVATDGDYRELRSQSLTLWLVRGQAPAPEIDDAGRARRRSQVALKLGLEVASIDEIASTVEAFGGTVAKATWEFGGYRRRDAVDPEGNVIQLLEPATDPQR